MEMPKYKSHKTVQALEIKDIADNVITPTEHNFPAFECDREMWARYTPKPGDFVVKYADGYMSFSPRKAFLEGYTRETQVHPSGSQI